MTAIPKPNEIKAPVTWELPFQLKTGMTVKVSFICDDLKKDFRLRLEDAKCFNVILHIRYKTGAKKWIFNSKEKGKWHSEETLIMLHLQSAVHLLKSSIYDIAIGVQEEVFAISVNSNALNNFRHRKNVAEATHLTIKGSLRITKAVIDTSKEEVNIITMIRESVDHTSMFETIAHGRSNSALGGSVDDSTKFERIATGKSKLTLKDSKRDVHELQHKLKRVVSHITSMVGLTESKEQLDYEGRPINPTASISAVARVITSEEELLVMKMKEEMEREESEVKTHKSQNIMSVSSNEIPISAVTPVISQDMLKRRSTTEHKIASRNVSFHQGHAKGVIKGRSSMLHPNKTSKADVLAKAGTSRTGDTESSGESHKKRQSFFGSRTSSEHKVDAAIKYYGHPQCWCDLQ